MATIPLIQPSASASRFGASSASHSIFSTPTVDIRDAGIDQDLLAEQDMEDDNLFDLHLDPSPVGKGSSVESWAHSNRTIAATFRPSTNEIAVYVAGKKAAEEFPVRQQTSAKDNTIFLCQASIPESRIPFITQTFDVFLKTTSKEHRNLTDSYKRLHGQYHEAITQYLRQLDEQSKNDMETEDAATNARELELVEGFGSIWQLAECVFLTRDEDKPIAFMYSEWLSMHDAGFDSDTGKVLLKAAGRLSHPQFWPYIHKCLLLGMKNAVIYMMEQTLSDEADEDVADALEAVLRLLKGIPSAATTVPDGKAYERHQKWHEACEKFEKSSQSARLGEGGEKAARIMAGDIDTILDTTESWEEAFSAILLYTNPDCPRYELLPILRICVEKYLQDVEATLLDKIKVAILEMDAIKTLRHCGSFHPWLVAHLADVFQQHGYLDVADLHLHDISTRFDSDVRDFFITSYAQSLMANPELWETIAGYLLRCGHTGNAMLSEWICHVPLESSQKAQTVLKFCESNGLRDSLRSINRVIGVEEVKRGQYALAIKHFIASKDDDRVAKVTDEVMLAYLQTGNLDFADALESIAGLPSNRHVDFLRSYAKFLHDYKRGNLQSAGQTLRKMVTLGKAPLKYWAMMLFDALPLLENKQEVIFDSSDTYELMWCLEEIVGSQHKAEYLQLLPSRISPAASTAEEREQQLNVVRLSLVRNLARSLVHPPKRTDTLMCL